MKAKYVYEKLEFERGKDPRKTLKLGKDAFPKVELFEEIFQYCSDNKFPGFEKVTPIFWWEDAGGNKIDEPYFKAYINYSSGNPEFYHVYLSKNEGVIVFHEYYNYDDEWMEFEHPIENFIDWTRMLEANHIQRIENYNTSRLKGLIPDVTESSNRSHFQRGGDPRDRLEIGIRSMIPELKRKYEIIIDFISTVRGVDYQLDFAKDILNIIGDLHLHRKYGWKNFHWGFEDLQTRDLIRVKEVIDKYYSKKILREGIDFKRGGDPHETLRIGKYSKDVPEIVSADIEIMPEPGNQDSYYDEGIDHWDIITVLNNWEESVKEDNYSFWVEEADNQNDFPDYWLWKDLEGTTVKYAGKFYDIPKTEYKLHG